MKEIFSSSNVVELHFLQDEFQKNGIPTEIQDKEISPSFSIKGGLPFPSNRLPSLWILHDEQYEEGKKILKQALKSGSLSSTSTRGWLCSQCEETNPEGFGICWNCGGP